MSKLETEVVWLGRRVQEREDLVKRLETYFKERQLNWSRGVMEYFIEQLEKMKDQLYFESSRLEKVAWKIHEERESGLGRDPAFEERLLD